MLPIDHRDCPFGILYSVPQSAGPILPASPILRHRPEDSPECQGTGSGDLRVSPSRSAYRGDLPLRCPLVAASPPCPRAVRLCFLSFYNTLCEKSIGLGAEQGFIILGNPAKVRTLDGGAIENGTTPSQWPSLSSASGRVCAGGVDVTEHPRRRARSVQSQAYYGGT